MRICQSCGGAFKVVGEDTACPYCNTQIADNAPKKIAAIPGQSIAKEEASAAGPYAKASTPAGAQTIFQPALLIPNHLLDSVTPEGETEPPPTHSSDTDRLADPATVPFPELNFGVEPYFLILGAQPGRERVSLERARTVVGRVGADVCLEDGAISSPHFQVDVMGGEYFVKDLGSTNGTYLNGRRIRLTELRPGDEIRAGRTTLLFRTSDDALRVRPLPEPRTL